MSEEPIPLLLIYLPLLILPCWLIYFLFDLLKFDKFGGNKKSFSKRFAIFSREGSFAAIMNLLLPFWDCFCSVLISVENTIQWILKTTSLKIILYIFLSHQILPIIAVIVSVAYSCPWRSSSCSLRMQSKSMESIDTLIFWASFLM